MVPVVIQTVVLDLCDPVATARIVAVDGDETSDRADWEITGPLTLNLRTRGLGRAKARTYYITVEASDAAGNTSQTIVPILVQQ
jgi:hypothetical protein